MAQLSHFVLGGDCFVAALLAMTEKAALLAMTTICHREPRRGVAISVHGDCFGGYAPSQ